MSEPPSSDPGSARQPFSPTCTVGTVSVASTSMTIALVQKPQPNQPSGDLVTPSMSPLGHMPPMSWGPAGVIPEPAVTPGGNDPGMQMADFPSRPLEQAGLPFKTK